MITISEKEFKQLYEYMQEKYGINLSHKKSLVVGRLQNFIAQNNFKSFSDYLNYVFSDKTGEAVKELINKLTTNHTYFMRENEHFEFFKSKVLPELIAKEHIRKDLRIWSAGCSSGEEPYTLAMIISSHLGIEKSRWDSKILATDISSKVLEIAALGVYLNEGMVSLPEKWKSSFFKKIDEESSGICDIIKNEVIFRKFNLMNESFPFKKKFHVIFCRNVMIYFDQETKNNLIKKFYDLTEPGGYLFIGHSESINRNETDYKFIMPAVFRKE